MKPMTSGYVTDIDGSVCTQKPYFLHKYSYSQNKGFIMGINDIKFTRVRAHIHYKVLSYRTEWLKRIDMRTPMACLNK